MTAVPSDAAKKVRRSLSKDVSSILISTPALVIWLAGGIITLAIGQIYICSFFLLLLADRNSGPALEPLCTLSCGIGDRR